MARVPTARQVAVGSGESTRKYYLGVQEAGGTSVTPVGKLGHLVLYKDRYDALTAGEKTAFLTLTMDELITTLADTFYVDTEM
jgi:hypothetical protein